MTEQLVNQFTQVRKDFLEALKQFPKDKVEEILFGEWSLKDVLSHFAGWDKFFTEILRLLKEGQDIPHWGNINKFNEKSVGRRKDWSWDEVYDEFVSAGEQFIKEYSDLPEELANSLFWGGKGYTPIKILKVNVHHYEKTQLLEMKKLLRKWGKK